MELDRRPIGESPEWSQVFALADSGDVQIGLICSEKQAIDATLRSLSKEDPRFCPVADKYWNARGGSHTDGGAFVLTVSPTDGESNGATGRCGIQALPTGENPVGAVS